MVTDDPLLVRWGLHDLLEGFSSALQNTGVCHTSVQTFDHAHTEYVQPEQLYTVRDEPGELYTVRDERDDALHTELAGGSENCHAWCNWQGPFTDTWPATQNDYPTYDYDGRQDSEGDGAAEWFEDFTGEVGKRLTHMEFIPHVPRINGEIPTVDDASAAHQRLFDRLRMYGLSELKVDGDGNCQFRAFSDQLYRSPAHHKSVREDVVMQLTRNPEYYEGYVPMKYNDYVKQMARSGEWGDHVTLQAAADFYGVRICLLTSFKDTSFVQILPRQAKSKRVIFLSFWAEVHYNSVYAEGDLPYSGQQEKNKHWKTYFKGKAYMWQWLSWLDDAYVDFFG